MKCTLLVFVTLAAIILEVSLASTVPIHPKANTSGDAHNAQPSSSNTESTSSSRYGRHFGYGGMGGRPPVSINNSPGGVATGPGLNFQNAPGAGLYGQQQYTGGTNFYG